MQEELRVAVSNYVQSASLTSADKGYISATEIFVNVEHGKLIVTNSNPDATPITFTQNEGQVLVGELGLKETQTNESGNGGLNFQIGANKGQTLNLGIEDMRSQALGIGQINISTQQKAISV